MVKNEDGTETEKEYFTAEDLQAKENEWKAKQEELEKDINPNWREAREKIKRLEALEKKGKTIDDQGEIKETTPQINPAEIEQKAIDRMKKEMIEDAVNESLGRYNEEQKKVVKYYFDKLTTGEQLTAKNVDNFIRQAEVLASPQQDNRASRFSAMSNGKAPNENIGDKGFGETEQGRSVANLMGLRYINK